MRQLEKANHKFISVLGSDDITVIAQADEAFHGLIYQATDNDRLIQMVNHLREQMYRYRIEHIKDRSQRKLLVQEHQEIMRALSARDVEATRRTIRNHINKQEITVGKHIKKREEEP